MEKPILGHGLGSSRYIEPDEKYYGHVIDDNGKGISLNPLPIHPHNNILQVMLEMGLVGLMLFTFYIQYLLRGIKSIGAQNKKFSICASGIFLTYFIIGMISFNMVQSWWMMVVLLAVTLMSLTRNV
jgi:O-antigen ligase